MGDARYHGLIMAKSMPHAIPMTKQFQIFYSPMVCGDNKLVPIQIENTWSIQQVKDTIAFKEGNKSSQLLLIFDGKRLDESCCVFGYEINSGTVIEVVLS